MEDAIQKLECLLSELSNRLDALENKLCDVEQTLNYVVQHIYEEDNVYLRS